jgi:predicted nucleic-acid-binding Zn-ribbon protein
MSPQTASPPSSCAKCGGRDLQRQQLTSYGKFGAIGRGYRFDVYICRACGYAESYFVERTALKVL